MSRSIAIAWLALLLSAGGVQAGEPVGHPAPPLELRIWLNSPPLDMSALKGKVVLLRWWTDGCPLCAATAPALRKLAAQYGNRGFTVIGVYHPKPPGDWNVARVRHAAAKLGFHFPVAIDGDWSALKRWWLTDDRDYTSVSFLVDKRGVIRYVQPGGEWHEGGGAGHEACRRDYREIDAMIAKLVSE